MKKFWLIVLAAMVTTVVILLAFYNRKNNQASTGQYSPIASPASNIQTAATPSEPTPSQTQTNNQLTEPIADFKARITKKPFGIYITPETSPVQPEKFSGYHNAVDVEYGDINSDVDVFAVYDGTIIYSGFVNGYGGFVAIQHDFDGEKTISLYGHLNPDSLAANGAQVIKGDKIGILGNAFSSQTDNERKHLHFAILKGENLNFRGYVQNESELSLWQNPLDFYD